MKRWMAALGGCAALATLSGGAFAHHGYDPDGNALRGAVAGGLMGSSAAPAVAIVHEVQPAAWFRHRRQQEW